MSSFRLSPFYPILDTRALAARGLDPLTLARALLEAGVGILQLRHKDSWTRQAFRLAAEISQLAAQAQACFVVNDRADIALAVGAAGVHLGQRDLTPAAVRGFAGNRLLIGLSTHNEAQLRAAAHQPVDYLALGPIFATASKERPDPVVGLEELRRLRVLSKKPLSAIGGISLETAPAVLEAGADSCAVISDMLEDDWRARVRSWRALEPPSGAP